MSKAPLLLLTGALFGCSAMEPRSYSQCEDYVKAKLKTPATYQRASVEGIAMKEGREFWVHVTYDAQNEYGALIRDQYICQFPATNGQADTSNYVDFDEAYEGAADNMEALTDNLTSAIE